MNQVKVDIKRIECVVTHTCSGKCKHCSAAAPGRASGGVDADAAARAIEQLAGRYQVESVMTFGGEPLLYADATFRIHAAAREAGIPMRQIITNGFFSRDESVIERTAARLLTSGANDIMLSMDAFHQEFIPLEYVLRFAEALLQNGAEELCVHPAWLVSEEDENPYNIETRRIVKMANDKGVKTSSGNVIFPAGNAPKYLGDYFPAPENVDLSAPCGTMPYTGRPDEVTCVSIGPEGDLSVCAYPIGNINKDDALDILDRYNPYENPVTRALLDGGAAGLIKYAKTLGIEIDTRDCYSPCEACKKAVAALS